MDDLQTRYNDWKQARQDYSKREESGPLPTANEWEWSDDEAVLLLHEAMGALWAANNVIGGLQSKAAVQRATDEMIRELTRHADLMRELLDRYREVETVDEVCQSYDEFIREC